MIIGNIRDFSEKDFASANIKTAFAYLKSHDLLALPVGKTVIDGDKVILNRQSYLGKEEKDAKIENHDHHLDLQLVLKGTERFGYVNAQRTGLRPTSAYDPTKDRTNYEGPLDGEIDLHAGDFALVYPSDLHQACVKVDDGVIEKAVFKILID
jgi:YhcH/YjgK/YiaL family protein